MFASQHSVQRTGRWLWWTVCCYLVAVLLLWFFMWYAGDRWWPGTLVLFAPRWVVGLPLLVLVPLAVWWHQRSLIILGVISFVVAVPLMGLVVSSSSVPASGGTNLRVLSCNTAKAQVYGRLSQLIQDTAADIVALQECPRELPVAIPKGWHWVQQGELAILSRFPLVEYRHLTYMHPPHIWPRYAAVLAVVDTPQGRLGFCAVHLPSPRYGLEHLLDRTTGISLARTALLTSEIALRSKTAWELKRLLASVPLPLLVAGDFNMPVESSLYRENFHQLGNAFSSVGLGYGYTEHSVKRGVGLAVRIDHVLMTNEFQPQRCVVGPDVGSDHLPLIADVTWR